MFHQLGRKLRLDNHKLWHSLGPSNQLSRIGRRNIQCNQTDSCRHQSKDRILAGLRLLTGNDGLGVIRVLLSHVPSIKYLTNILNGTENKEDFMYKTERKASALILYRINLIFKVSFLV